MTMHIEAIYEHGVLRPTKPLNLPEGERVELALIASSQIESRRLAKAERDAREIEIINRNIDELNAEAWDALYRGRG
ncbi:MAG TPA: antitoxin family protein [Blastocatellia bacterium]|nr:antitoxin family protein [Blastocatellia bacterium]